MRTRLSPALAVLGVALLLSFIEAEGKKLFLPPLPVTPQNCRKKTKNKQKTPPNQPCLYCLLCFSALRVFSGGFSSVEKHSLLQRFVRFPALRSSSFIFCLIHCVQCCMVSLRLSLRCAVHTATYAAAFQEDQMSKRGRRLLAPLRTGYLQVTLRSPGELAGKLVWLVTIWLGAATSVTARNKRL